MEISKDERERAAMRNRRMYEAEPHNLSAPKHAGRLAAAFQ
jgi:hypothetical protein